MRPYLFHYGYTLANPRFYDDLGQYLAEGGLERRVNRLRSEQISTVRRGPWIVCRPEGLRLPTHGWKIHVSTVPDDAERALEIVLDEFGRDPFHFKCLRDRQLVVAATSRWWPAGQVGKAIVIYTPSADECRLMLERLRPLLDGIKGPYILTDRRYGDSSCLYYRYGTFAERSKVDHDGTKIPLLYGPDGQEWVDDRSPVYRKPPWVEDLFPEEPRTGPASRDIHGYRVQRALAHTGTGGLYLAERITDGTTVVLKESRPHTAYAIDGSSGQVRLERESETLKALSGSGAGPEAIDFFQEWEHRFLVQEYIEFGPLTTFLAAKSPLAHGDLSPESLATYRHQAQTVLANLRQAIAACHERGICYGDLSLTNIMVEPETLAVRLVDFESSRPFDEWHGDTPATPGFRPPPGSTAWDEPRAFDEFGVASVELALITPRNILRDLNPAALARSVRHAATMLDRPLGDLLERLELPAGDDPRPDMDLVIKEAVRFIEGTLTCDRDDRPFPTVPDVFVTNPWAIAHGVAGLVRGLHRLTGQVHPAVQDWMDRNTASLDSLPPSLYYGLAGVGWTMLDAGSAGQGLELIERASAVPLTEMSAGIVEGSAGIGLSCLAAWQRTKDDRWRDKAARIGDHLLATGVDSGFGLQWPEPGASRHTLGYGYGSAGIAAFLLYLHLATGETRWRRIARRALDFDMQQLRPRHPLSPPEWQGVGLPSYADQPILEPYWLRGSSGFGGVLARFCRVTGDEKLQDTLQQLVVSTLRGGAIAPGLFTGMAGIVNFALDCHHLLGAGYRELTTGMTDGILALACPQPEGLAFPGNSLMRYTNDFGTGSLGIALVLDRLHRGGPDFNYTLDELLPEPSHE